MPQKQNKSSPQPPIQHPLAPLSVPPGTSLATLPAPPLARLPAPPRRPRLRMFSPASLDGVAVYLLIVGSACEHLAPFFGRGCCCCFCEGGNIAQIALALSCYSWFSQKILIFYLQTTYRFPDLQKSRIFAQFAQVRAFIEAHCARKNGDRSNVEHNKIL